MPKNTKEHTPGPWEAMHATGADFWKVQTPSRFIAGDMNKPNALLVATAPALLTDLETLVDYLSEAHTEDKAADHYGDQTCSYCNAINQANTHIAKARGIASRFTKGG